jgi:hypothetical protein
MELIRLLKKEKKLTHTLVCNPTAILNLIPLQNFVLNFSAKPSPSQAANFVGNCITTYKQKFMFRTIKARQEEKHNLRIASLLSFVLDCKWVDFSCSTAKYQCKKILPFL